MSSLYSVKSIIILDSEGSRLLAKYYVGKPTLEQQHAFERLLAKKTMRSSGSQEIMLLDDTIVVFRGVADVMVYVVGSLTENELILTSVLHALFEAISILLQRQVDKRGILENLDYVLLAVDEVVDAGIILEADAELIASRVIMNEEGDVPLTDQTISQVFSSARDQIAHALLKG